MSKVNKLREKFGNQIRESVGGGEGSPQIVVDHPSRNLKHEGVSRAAGFANIPIGKIEADEQHREDFDDEELGKLADSLKSEGLIQPIVVRWNQDRKAYIIIAGERRFRAAKICAWESIKCDVKPDDITVGDIAEIQLAENLARKNLNPIEMAKAFNDVIAKNSYTARELSGKVGVDEATIGRYTMLLRLPADLQSKTANGEIPLGVAREIARLKGEGKQRKLLATINAKDLSVSQSRQLAVGNRVRSGRSKRRTSKNMLSFETDYGVVTTQFGNAKDYTYDHVLEMMQQALEEVQLRIRNGIRLTK